MMSTHEPKSWLFAAMMVALLFGTGCMGTHQTVLNVKQHPTEDVTIVHTYERGLLYQGHRFWHCTPQGEDLHCEKTCGGDIECPPAPGIIRADRSPAAQSSGANWQVAAEPAEPAEDEPAESAEDQPAEDETSEDMAVDDQAVEADDEAVEAEDDSVEVEEEEVEQ